MSISESQYYEAKVFLKALNDAYTTLQQSSKQQAEVDKLKCYENRIVEGLKQGQIKIGPNSIQKLNGFQSSRLVGVAKYAQKWFDSRLQGFDHAKSVGDLQSILQKALS